MNVLYLINYAGNGGSEKYVYNLVNAFNEKKCNCFFAYNEGIELAELMAKDKIITFKLEMTSPFDRKAAKALAKICAQNEIDIIHTHYPRENAIANLAKKYCKNLKVVYTNHFLTESPLLWKIINKTICRKTDSIIAVCNASRDLLVRNGFPKKKIRVIYNGAPQKPQNITSTIRSELGIGDDEFVIASLARFSSEKRMDFAVEIAKIMKETTSRKFRFVLAGDGNMYDEVKELIRKYSLEDVVLCPGYRTDSANILSGCDAFLNCSETEALSFAIVEALSHSKPCVVSAVGGNVEIVRKENNCGTACCKDNPKEFADAFIELMENKELYEKYVQGAKQSYDRLFCLDKSLSDTFEVYNNVNNKKH